MKKILVMIFALSLVMSGFGCSQSQAEKGAAQDFSLTDINGETVQLSSFKGKVILLNFFASWCPPCRMEMPDFNEIAKTRDDVAVVAVNVGDESVQKISEFAKSNGLTFPIAKDDNNVSRMYGPIRAIPVTILIDKNFNIAEKFIGARSKADFEAAIDKIK
jgi:peroxiredoxin